VRHAPGHPRLLSVFLVVASVFTLLVVPLTSVRTASAAAFTPGNLVLERIGDGAANLSNAATPVFLDEYTPAGVLVQSVAMPTITSGANHKLTDSGTATTAGYLTRSVDGKYLVVAGYDAAPGTLSVATTSSGTVNRVVGRVDSSGNVDTTMALTDAMDGSGFRSAASTDGTKFWMAGGNGIRFADFGSTTSSALATNNVRQAAIFGGQFYVSSGSPSIAGINTVGTGLPESGSQTVTTQAATSSPYGFVLLDLEAAVAGVDTMYVADETSGLLKFSLVGGSWTSNGSAGVGTDAYRGLTAVVVGTTVTLYATRRGGSGTAGGGQLVSLVDASGYNGAFSGTPTLLATASTNTALRGVALAPVAAGGSATATSTATATETATVTPTATATASETATVTATSTLTRTPTPTSTPTVTLTSTQTRTPTLTPTATHTATSTLTVTPFASQILSTPGVCVNAGDSGTPWSQESEARQADGQIAIVSPSGFVSQSMHCSGYDFSGLPANANLIGIEVLALRQANADMRLRDGEVRLTHQHQLVAASRGGSRIETGLEDQSFGGITDLWGESWSPTDLQTSGVEVYYPVRRISTGPATVSLDALRVRVWYLLGDTPTPTQTGGTTPSPSATAFLSATRTPTASVTATSSATATLPPGATVTRTVTSVVSPTTPRGPSSLVMAATSCDQVDYPSGTAAWDVPMRAQQAEGNVAVSELAVSPTNHFASEYLRCTGYDFSAIPQGATITGIEVLVLRQEAGPEGYRAREASLRLLRGLILNGADQAQQSGQPFLPTSPSERVYGSPADLWGSGWSRAELQSGAGFGVVYAARRSGSTYPAQVQVDALRVRVHFTT
jgi:hypothetical protein